MKRRLVIVGVVTLQMLFLLGMAGEREWISRTGQVVTLATAPIDPNDPMRGDYVRLNYDFSRVPRKLCRDGLIGAFGAGQHSPEWRDEKVYGSIRLDPNGVGEMIALSDLPPTAGLFMRGRIEHCGEAEIDVRWGVEAIFMEQGKAKKWEDERITSYAGTPLHVNVAVSPGGKAVVKSYEWAPLGMTLTFETEPRVPSAGPATVPRPRAPAVVAVTVELRNMSQAPIAILDLPEQQSFRLVASVRGSTLPEAPHVTWVGETLPVAPPTAENLRVLQAGESFRTRIDLKAARWLVQQTDDQGVISPAKPLGEIEDSAWSWFRIEYAPPIPATLLNSTMPIQYTRLFSRGFAPRGRID